MNDLDKHLTAYFENYAQSVVNNDDFGCCLADSICYYSENIKNGLAEWIEENFDLSVDQDGKPTDLLELTKIVELVFENLMPDDYIDVQIGHMFSKTTELDIVFLIEEIEYQIPDELSEYESEEFYVSGDCAYCPTDEIIIYSPDFDILENRVQEAIDELITIE